MTFEIKYWDASHEAYVYHQGEVVRSGAGRSAGPEYGIVYKLDDGRFLGGVRHHDRGDLMTEIRYGKTEKSVFPDRWR